MTISVGGGEGGSGCVGVGAMKFIVVLLVCALLVAPLLLSQFAVRADAEANQRVETSTSVDAAGDRRDAAKWMRRAGSEWLAVGEWSVEIFNHREQGEKKETQSLSFESNGDLRRRVKRENIEGIETDCGQACKCKVWQTRTIFTEEDELYRWSESARKAERIAYQKWYITQPEESVFSICKKLNIAADRFVHLYRMNPEVQKMEKLPEGYRLVVEKVGR